MAANHDARDEALSIGSLDIDALQADKLLGECKSSSLQPYMCVSFLSTPKSSVLKSYRLPGKRRLMLAFLIGIGGKADMPDATGPVAYCW